METNHQFCSQGSIEAYNKGNDIKSGELAMRPLPTSFAAHWSRSGKKSQREGSFGCRDVREIESSLIPAGRDTTVRYVISGLRITERVVVDMSAGTRLFLNLYWLYIDFR
jgi:hypothetical protein